MGIFSCLGHRHSLRVFKRLGLPAGAALFVLVAVAPAPAGMGHAAQLTLAVALLMALWWLTEAVPVAVTALVPLVLLPLTGVMSAADISAPYASKTNFLFLGGLIIATALEKWNLHRRIALSTIVHFGSSPKALVLGFMVATAAISMWISNSATTMMMLPIAMAVCRHFDDKDSGYGQKLAPILLLAVAYSATIGGLGTLVGTPPNAVFAGAFSSLFPQAPEVGFFQWMMVGVPIVAIMIPLAWAYLVYLASDIGRSRLSIDRNLVGDQLRRLGPMTGPERRVLAVFSLTALLWMFRRNLDLGSVEILGWAALLPEPSLVGDSTVAIAMALLLFVLPAGDKDRSRLLDWQSAVKLPWGVILLLGGGFALAEAIRVSGLATWLGLVLAWVGQAPPLLSILVVATLISLVTEVTTNTAITTIMMPILAASAVAGGCDPLLLMVPCTLAASLCFMMPSGTAPNAIVFSSGRLSVPYMARVGVGLNLIAVVMVTAITWFIAISALNISLDSQPGWALSLVP